MNERPVKAGQVFTTFIFDDKDCADMGVYAITNSSTYTYNLEPTFKDEKLDVPAYDGQYYYGTQLSTQQFQFNMFADNLSLKEYQALKTWLFPQKIGKLILPEQPFKYYVVKVTSVGALGNIPLTDIQTATNSALGDYNEGNVVYVGKFTVTFQTVGSVYGYGMSYYRDDLIYDALDYYGKDVYPDNYFYDSGMLYKDMAPALKRIIPANAEDFPLTWYNPGTAKAIPLLTLTLNNTVPAGGYIQINNNTTNASTIIKLNGLSGVLTIDTDEETIIDENGRYYFGRFSGNPIAISADKDVIYIPESLVENTEQFLFQDYDNIYISNSGTLGTEDNTCTVSINPLAQLVDASWENNYYFCINNNGGALINQVDTLSNELLLNPLTITYDIPPAVVSPDGTVIRRAGFICRYTQEYDTQDDLPRNANVGDVAMVRVYTGHVPIKDNYGNDIEYPNRTNVMFLYRYGKWELTNLFTSKDEFFDNAGNQHDNYLVFGANVIKIDNITISTNIAEDFELDAAILPRYI